MENSSEIRFFSEVDLLELGGSFPDTPNGVCHKANKKQIFRLVRPSAAGLRLT